MKKISFIAILFLLGCASGEKTYENDVFPKGDFKPINPINFSNKDAKNIREGKI